MKKLITMLLILGMILAPLPMSRAEVLPEKDEVVYAKFDHTGQFQTLSVVNVFRLAQGQVITDYGPYRDVLNLTSLDPITQAGDKVRVKAAEGVFYYQGNHPDQELPWLVEIEYRLDGNPVEAEDLAGRNGRLEILLDIRQNPKADPVFFEHYVLQVSFQFPQDRFELIEAVDATQALSGEDQLLNFTVLPGKEASFHVTAEVRDFSMKPMMINGLPFQMAFDLPNLDGSLGDLTKLQEGIKQLNDGARALADGLESAAGGGWTLLGGADTLAGSGQQMSGGVSTFHDGLTQYQTGIHAYRDGVVQFDDGLGRLVGGIRELSNGLDDYADGSDQATDGLNQYVDGVNAYIGGIQQLLTTVQPLIDQLDGVKDLIGEVDIREAIQDTITASNQMDQALKLLVQLLDQENLEGLADIQAGSTDFLATLDGLDQSGIDFSAVTLNLQAAIDNLDANLAIIAGVASSLRYPDLTAIGADASDPNTLLLLAYMAGRADELDAAVAQIQLGTRPALVNVRLSLEALESQFNETLTQVGSLADRYRPIDAMIQGLSETDIDELKNQITVFSQNFEALHQKMTSFLEELSENLPETIEQVQDGIDQVRDGMDQLQAGGTQLMDGGEEVREGFSQLNEGAHDVADGARELADGADLIRAGAAGLAGGITTLAMNFDQMVSGSGQISWGLSQLAGGMNAYRDGVAQYVSGVAQAGDGSRQLADGTGELHRQTSGMDQMLQAKISELTEDFLPKDFTPVSFVSSKNKTVKVVQFVLMGEAINRPVEETSDLEEPAEKNIWERIKDLF